MDPKTILLVEDNPDDVELMRVALGESNVLTELVVVHDGVEALDYLFGAYPYQGRGPKPLPDVVVLDLKLPKVDGKQVLQRLRADERTRLLPVIVVTSSREAQDVLESYSLGANSYVCKPVDYLQFVEAIRQLGLYWLVLNEPPPGTGRG